MSASPSMMHSIRAGDLANNPSQFDPSASLSLRECPPFHGNVVRSESISYASNAKLPLVTTPTKPPKRVLFEAGSMTAPAIDSSPEKLEQARENLNIDALRSDAEKCHCYDGAISTLASLDSRQGALTGPIAKPNIIVGSEAVPFMELCRRTTNANQESPKLLYDNLDTEALQLDADNCLLNYGTAFNSEIITHASDVFIYTSTGRRILDMTSGQMSCLIGHGHPEVVQIITEHATSLDHLFSGMLSPPVIQLAKRLTDLLPDGLDKAFFLSTGGESNEAAIKLAKVVTGKYEIVGLGASWHGMTGAAVGAQYHSGRKGYGPMIPGNHVIVAPNEYRSIFRHSDGTYDWQAELNFGWDMVDCASSGSLAAVIMEPILSSGGMLTLPIGYMKAMKAHCERRGMLLIVDEAQTGIGRCGDMFAFQHEDVVPDILTLSKTLGNGLPLSAVVTSNHIAQISKSNGYLFYTTHVNDPLPAAVGLKVLEIVVRDDLVDRSRKAGFNMHRALQKLKSRYGCIGDVRGRGLMAGIEIVSDQKSKKPDLELGKILSEKMVERGLSANLATMASFGGVFRIAPPIIISDADLAFGLSIMEEAFSATEGSMPLYSSDSEVDWRAFFSDTKNKSPHRRDDSSL